MPAVPPDVSEYRFAPAVSARIVGGLLVVVAVLLAVLTLVVALAGLSVLVLVAGALAGVAAVFVAGHLVTRRVPVVRMDTTGYQVRMVRGAGVHAAAWREVLEAVTATPQGLPVVVLRLTDARETTIPVTLLDVDREQFVRDLQGHLRRGQGLRPLT
ncbi:MULTISPECIES: hypothetical protein [unclassified Nocardioides]|uniref:hypothetical protein n=1 Tax=unclassified Nocardioides TaxID=2615069 RepID=UPI000A52142D|nr:MULTISPECIES: hypothetical protein [unclassified Nocardioides]